MMAQNVEEEERDMQNKERVRELIEMERKGKREEERERIMRK